MNERPYSRISIQVSLSGYSFELEEDGKISRSGWLSSDKVFTTKEFLRRYDRVELSLLTPKAALIPEQFFDPSSARAALAETVRIRETDLVEYVAVPQHAAVLVYSNSLDETLSRVLSQTVLDKAGNPSKVYPELYRLLCGLPSCTEYNKILASYMDGCLHLVIAQGKTLLLANAYDAPDFTTAEYYIFLAMKSLQLNPEMSSIWFRTPVSGEQELSLYRYFKSVERF
ncbi:MAG: DUF3822 family protein [Bacteroidales bacterium]|nr:DUF3822 family protein [Bacteroidales bacterium]